MIKTLRITSIVAAMLAAVLLVLPAVFGVRSDAKIEEFLKSPGAVDNFLAAKGQRPARSESQTSPLVKEAVDFARYLNPPPPPPTRSTPAAARPASQPAPPAPVAPKFNLIGTSFYAARPELSLALIDEPGKGFNWVRQGSTVGHLTIEYIKDGSITIRDSHGTSEMTVTVNQPWRSLLKNPPPETQPASTPSAGPAPLPPDSIVEPAVRPDTAAIRRPGFDTGGAQPQAVLQAESEISDKSGTDGAEPPISEQQARIDQLIAEMDPSKVTEEEMEKLTEQLFEQVEQLEKIKQSESPDPPDVDTPSDANQ